MKKSNRGIKMFFGSVFTLIIGVMAICVVLFFLGTYLFKIQIPERLRYVKDYSDFVLEIEPVAECTNELYSLFQVDDVVFRGICVQDVSIRYGNTQAPLELVLREKYIGLKELTKKWQNVNTTDKSFRYYEYRRSEEENENYRVVVATNPYYGSTLTEVTFEVYAEETPEIEDISVTGTADISKE